MKKNSLTSAIVAGVAGVVGLANVASAVNLNPDGLGQALIYPYYTVNGGNATLLSVVNTTNEVKAVKVRFLEGQNSREVLDFNLYLSPFDVWTAAVTDGGDATGPGILATSDTSCTHPLIPAAGQAFRNFAYTGSSDDDGPNSLDRTREGHVEMIEMGVVTDVAPRLFATRATHSAGVPNNCARLRASWGNAAEWDGNPGLDITPPSGGLFGAGVIVDVENGTGLAYNADAIDRFFTVAGHLHTDSGFTTPSLSQAQTSLGEADAVVFDGSNAGSISNGVVTLDFVSGRPDAVSSIFMADTIYNEYNSNDSLVASSEWVVTFPTKRLHIEPLSATAAQRRPFTDNVDSTNNAEASVFDTAGSCEPISIAFFDREEGPEAPGQVDDFSPLPEDVPVTLSLCYEANVVTFNQQAAVTAGASEVLGSRIARNLNLTDAANNEIQEGWVAMELGDDDNFLLDGSATDGVTPRNQLFGLPVTGFWAANFVNTAAQPGILANYAVLSKHRQDKNIRAVTVDGTGTITATGFAAS